MTIARFQIVCDWIDANRDLARFILFCFFCTALGWFGEEWRIDRGYPRLTSFH